MARGRPKKSETGEIRMSEGLPKIITRVATLNKLDDAVNGQATTALIDAVLSKHYDEGYRLVTAQVVNDASDSIVILYVMQMKDE